MYFVYVRCKLENTTPFISGQFIRDILSLSLINEASTKKEKISLPTLSLSAFHGLLPTASWERALEDLYFKTIYVMAVTAKITSFISSSKSL